MNLLHLAARSTATGVFGITGNTNCTLPGEKIETRMVNSDLREIEQQPFNKTECT